MEFTSQVTERGVTERAFVIDRPAEPVPGILWTPEGAAGPRPLVLFGHGGSQHKRAPNILALARRLVRHHGHAAVAIDLPFHGDRRPAAERSLPGDERIRRLRRRMFGDQHGEIIEQALGDWAATLDAVLGVAEVGAGPVGYWGLSMGTHIGVPLLAREDRIVAAVLGLFGWAEGSPLAGYDDLARRVAVPVLFLVQWDDELAPRDAAFELFDLLGSSDKTLHANPGVHVAVPAAEADASEAFLAQRLGSLAASTGR